MKEFLKDLKSVYIDIFSFCFMFSLGLLYMCFVFSPIITSIFLENAWYMGLYIIVGPILKVICKSNYL